MEYLGLKSVYEAFYSPLADEIERLSLNQDLMGTNAKIIVIAKKIFVVTTTMALIFFIPASTLNTFSQVKPISLYVVTMVCLAFASFSVRAIDYQMRYFKDIFI